MERISGPYKGYFIAAYTVGNEPNFVGYAKICITEPQDVWNAATVEKLLSATGFRTEQEAIAAAERKARHTIAEIVGSWDHVTGAGALE
jgi:hypothetical protein